jgi:hypothetical protein
MNENYVGYFRGRKTIQRSATVGGARSVFVKLQGNKNELVYPTFGGYIKNPFKGPAKIFAGDLMEYRTDENGLNPEIYVLKTYLVHSSQDDIVNIVNDGYKHIPFVGDKIGAFEETIQQPATMSATILSVKDAIIGGVKVWECKMDSAALALLDGVVLAEVNKDNSSSCLKTINAVAPTDLDMFDAPATGDEDFDGARYSYTPALGGIMYTNKMSPLPEFAKKFNKSNINGWFQIQSV